MRWEVVQFKPRNLKTVGTRGNDSVCLGEVGIWKTVVYTLSDNYVILCDDEFLAKVSLVELHACLARISDCEVSEDGVAYLLGKETCLAISIEQVVVEDVLFRGVVDPWVDQCIIAIRLARVETGVKNEHTQSESDVGMGDIVVRLSNW